MKKKIVIMGCALALAGMLVACSSKEDPANKDPLTGQENSQTQESSSQQQTQDTTQGQDEFGAMLQDEGTSTDSILDYIGTNIVDAGTEQIERFFSGLFGREEDIRNIDFTKLDDSRQYLPEDMIAFMELMKIEKESPSMVLSNTENRKMIGLTLSEMLERAVLFEQHIAKYPDHVSTQPARRLYEEIATQAISGGYDSVNGIENYYQGDTKNQVDQKSIQYYQQFVQANPDSYFASIVKEYMELLRTNEYEINDQVEDFYRSLASKLYSFENQSATQGNENNEMPMVTPEANQ